MLHIIKHHSSILEAIENASSGDEILLVEDAVYAAIPEHKSNKYLQDLPFSIYGLNPDMEARGLTALSIVQLVDFIGFVELTDKHTASITWE